MTRRRHKTLGALAVLLLSGWSGTAAAQQPGAPALGAEARTDSEYAGELPGHSGLLLEFQSLATRDDNVVLDNTRRQGDYLFQQGVLLKLWEKTPRWNLDLQYHPSGLLYRSTTGLDSFDQGLTFEGAVQARPHLLLRWSDTFTRTTGLAQLVANQDVFLPAGPGPRLNTALHAPLAQELGNHSSLDMVYELSRRGSLDLSGSYEFADFTGSGAPTPQLVSQRSASAGLSYDYRLTRHVTVGTRYLFQRYHFRAGTQDDTHSAYLTASWEVSPHVLFSFFAGPQYSLTDGLFAIPGSPGASSFLAVSSQQWEPAGGASLTFRSDRTVVRLTGQRSVADGDGLLSSVVSWYGAAEVRRRIIRGWDLVLTGSDARSLALQGPFGFGEVNTQSAGLALERPLFGNFFLHAEYGYFRERTNQNVAFTTNVDRNRYTLGLFYRTALRRRE